MTDSQLPASTSSDQTSPVRLPAAPAPFSTTAADRRFWEFFTVAAYVEDLGRELAPATVKQHLAAIRMLFDWLVLGHAVRANPAAAVRGP